MELPEELRAALEAEEGGELARLLRLKRPTDLEALRRLLSLDPSIPSDFRTKAMYALGRWGDASVVPEISRLLPQLDERERISALSALGHLGTPEAAAEILPFAEDASPQVRKAATIALARTGTPKAMEKLREIAASDPLPWIREVAGRHIR